MARSKAIGWSVIAWVAIWAFWLATTRGYHANWPLATIATTALVGSYAAAAYINQLVLVPKFLHRQQYIGYAAWLVVVMVVLTGLALCVLRLFYVKILGPFPVKPWYVDYGIDLFGMVVHVLAAAGVVAAFRRWFATSRTVTGSR